MYTNDPQAAYGMPGPRHPRWVIIALLICCGLAVVWWVVQHFTN